MQQQGVNVTCMIFVAKLFTIKQQKKDDDIKRKKHPSHLPFVDCWILSLSFNFLGIDRAWLYKV